MPYEYHWVKLTLLEVIIGYFRKMPVDERELFKAIGASFSKLRRTKSLADTR